MPSRRHRRLPLACAWLAALSGCFPVQVYSISAKTLTGRQVTAELSSPVYRDGTLSTDTGGVIKGENFFIQAEHIRYTKKGNVHRVEAEGRLLFIFKNRAYTGRRLVADLEKGTTEIWDGCTSSPPWFIGGKTISLQADGSGVITGGYLTTSENAKSEWAFDSNDVTISPDAILRAHNVRLLCDRIPIFWFPTLSKDLKNRESLPVSIRLRRSSGMHVQLGIEYRLPTISHFHSKLLFDVSSKKGIGGGLEMTYKSPLGNRSFSSLNYYAHDLFFPEERDKPSRYRFQGKYLDFFESNNISLKGTYDKLSDSDVPGDYIDRGLDSVRTGQTGVWLGRKEPEWMATLATRVKINDFQTVKQEFPYFDLNIRPLTLFGTGCVVDSRFNAGYLDYDYSKKTAHVHNFHSGRVEHDLKLYRAFLWNHMLFTPKVGYAVIGYGNSPAGDAKLAAVGRCGLDWRTRLVHRMMGCAYESEPYAQYEYQTTPSVEPHHHYLFDLNDALGRVNDLRFGWRHFIASRTLDAESGFSRRLRMDLYSRLFINSPNVGPPIPRAFADFMLYATPRTSYSINSGWDLQRNIIDHLNIRGAFTVNEDIAFALEWRKRSPFAWRKVDQENFVLDTLVSTKRLRHSPLSDKRETALAHAFFRLTPTLALEVEARHGWGRRHSSPYMEYECNLSKMLFGVAKVSLNFQHRQDEKRWGLYFSVGEKPYSSNTQVKKFGQGNYDW